MFLRTASCCVFLSILCLCMQSNAIPIKDTSDKLGENTFVCFACKTVVTVMKSKFNSNATQQLLKRKLTKDCMILTKNNTELCSAIVPITMNFLNSTMTLNNTEICQLLTLCPKTNYTKPFHKSSVSKDSIVTDIIRSGEEEMTGLLCPICKMMVKAVDDYLLTKVDGISDYVAKVCKNLPKPASDECTDLIKSMDLNKTLPLVIKTVLDPEDVCEIIGSCSPTFLPIDVTTNNREVMNNALSKAKAGFVIKEIQKSLDNVSPLMRDFKGKL